MDQQRQRPGRGRRRQRRPKPKARTAAPEPILIAARRPNSPLLQSGKPRSSHSPSAQPNRLNGTAKDAARLAKPATAPKAVEPAPKRTARIIQLPGAGAGDLEKQRQRLLDRLMNSEGRGAISRAADEYRQAGFEFPDEQAVQLQLLEHFDEEQARAALVNLEILLEREAPIKKPIFEQRLRRLEECADEPDTRAAAAALRRVIRA